ncbi:MAG: hypothetical protein K9W44_04195 [Candidatus Lokiarchaeota archaeon]|nr:hypothetical protein [Candidatus Harpocratesius repetitus]
MHELPYIHIQVISKSSKSMTKRALLEKTLQKFKKTHKARFSWGGTEDNPILKVNYDSEADFRVAYEYGVDGFLKIVQILQEQNFPFDLLYTHKEISKPASSTQINKDKEESEDVLPSIEDYYVVLEYLTNRPDIMRHNYQMTWRVSQIIGTRFFVEETATGFIIFFDRKVDYDIAQLDRENPQELLEWVKSTPIGEDSQLLAKLVKIIQQNIH